MEPQAAPVHLYVAAYLDPLSAACDWDDLKRREHQGMIELDGLAFVTRDRDGTIRLMDSGHGVRRGASIGMVGGELPGLVFPPARFADGGEELDELLPPNSSGIVAMSEERWSVGVERALMNAIRIRKSKLGRETAEQLKRRAASPSTDGDAARTSRDE
jgi:hypothetical protein